MSTDTPKYTRDKTAIARTISPDLGLDDLWKLTEKGLLYKYFKEKDDYLNDFFRHVDQIVTKKNYTSNSTDTSGSWLYFSAGSTMFCGLAEEFSDGFFDSAGLPPPELWVGHDQEMLICFIPKIFIEKATAGIEAQMCGSLEWA